MRMTRLFGRRLRERTGGSESRSHDLLLRAGFVRLHAAGIYSYLTPGLRALRRIERIVREEMERAGAQEILMPVVHSADAWKASGRFTAIDATLVRFHDRRGRDMVLGMTHEEIVAQLAAGDIASWRDVDVVVYQIQTKFRDEARPRAGLLRTREFVMKDAYSLHLDRQGLDDAYESQAAAYVRIFRRVGLADVRRVRSATGDMGGDVAHEFVAPLDVGEDTIASCGGCGAASNVEVLQSAAQCVHCGGPLETHRAVEVGNIFQLGTRYAQALGASAVDRSGTMRPLLMGSYGIGISRLLATLIEIHNDAAGIALPAVCAPFDACIIGIGGSAGQVDAEDVYARACGIGLDSLFDDRDARAGEKFADADLIGAPIRLVIGGRAGQNGCAEIRERRSGRIHEVARDDVLGAAVRLLEQIRRAEENG